MQIEIVNIEPKEKFIRFGVKFYPELDMEIEIKGCRYFTANEKRKSFSSGPGIPGKNGRFFNLVVWSKPLADKITAMVEEELKTFVPYVVEEK